MIVSVELDYIDDIMKEAQILMGIMQNDDRAWRYICRKMKPGFMSILTNSFSFGGSASEDLEDIFQESLIILMQKVKAGRVVLSREGALFSYLVQIGKLTACNLIKKRRTLTPQEEVTIAHKLHKEDEDFDISVHEKQQTQNDFLDRVFDSLPDTCRTIFVKFYWDRKPLDEIADIIGYGNADSVKTKKSKCMKKFTDIAQKLIENDEFAEEAVRAAVERAALKELINEERIYAETGMTMAALDIEDDESGKE